MKKLFIILSFLIASSSLSYSQCCYKPNSLNYLVSGGGEDYGGFNFQFYGNETESFLDSLLLKFPESKRKDFTWKIKNVSIEGVDGEITLEIRKGLKGYNENKNGYFHTFQNDKDKEQLLSRKKESEMPGILIYVKNGRKNALKSEDMASIVKEYLLSIKG